MKCDRCDNEATVHEVTVRQGAKVERHLCEACAAQQGLAAQGAIPISNLISKFSVASVPSAAPPNLCPSCRLTFSEFRQSGHLGCPDCYAAFDKSLTPLLERWHEGGSSHTGKVPKRQPVTPPRPAAPDTAPDAALALRETKAEAIRRLRKKLDEAIEAEQYETAAKLRDQLKTLEHPPGIQPPPGGEP